MLRVSIPGYNDLVLGRLVLDYNGTVACDGEILPGVGETLTALAETLEIHVLTADTFGKAQSRLKGLPCELVVLPTHRQDVGKLVHLKNFGAADAVCIGNGRNDRLMLKEAALGIALIVGFAWKYQDRMAFPGAAGALPYPSTLGIDDGRIVEVVTSDSVRLRGWYLPPNPPPRAGSTAPGLLWFYGNMESIEGIAPVLREFRPVGIGMLALDYRGYGSSTGVPTEAGVYRDAEAAWEFLVSQSEIDSTRIAVYGRSIGSAVALYLATERPVRAVALDSPFTSGRDMASEHYSFLPQALVRLSLDNVGRAQRLSVPLLVFHGTEDWIAPVEMARSVAQAGRAEELVEIEGAGHNDTYVVGSRRYVDRFHDFLQTHLK